MYPRIIIALCICFIAFILHLQCLLLEIIHVLSYTCRLIVSIYFLFFRWYAPVAEVLRCVFFLLVDSYICRHNESCPIGLYGLRFIFLLSTVIWGLQCIRSYRWKTKKMVWNGGTIFKWRRSGPTMARKSWTYIHYIHTIKLQSNLALWAEMPIATIEGYSNYTFHFVLHLNSTKIGQLIQPHKCRWVWWPHPPKYAF